jgi:hypothetical protein
MTEYLLEWTVQTTAPDADALAALSADRRTRRGIISARGNARTPSWRPCA